MSLCPFDNVTDTADSLVSSCCVDYQTSVNIFYRSVQGMHVITSILGVYFSLHYIVLYSSSHFLPQNTKSFQASVDDPCSVRNTVAFCSPFRYSFAFCVLVLLLNQYFMIIDRLLDNFWPSYKSRFDVSKHFKATMHRDALRFMRLTAITQAVIITLYPVLVLAVRFSAHKTPRTLNKTLASFVYVSHFQSSKVLVRYWEGSIEQLNFSGNVLFIYSDMRLTHVTRSL
ncbi:unnamed protein product [Nippostrongylus brasiliensis]|uniref:G protein-coupled receptor n=1 Tax=Nippostrongylus brasiliensis TaxID=27835 RepID=A0A0N4Y2J6_NIPBR|nr:unnamed protein product [Nippostrongylus brasiliensis]